MDDFFEIMIYVVAVGFFVIYNVKKSQKQKESSAAQPSISNFFDGNSVQEEVEGSYRADETPKYTSIVDLYLSKDKIKDDKGDKIKENVNKETSIDLGLKQDLFNPIFDNQISEKQKTRRFNLRKAIVLSEIINRPYN